jgi:hypothetical protein
MKLLPFEPNILRLGAHYKLTEVKIISLDIFEDFGLFYALKFLSCGVTPQIAFSAHLKIPKTFLTPYAWQFFQPYARKYRFGQEYRIGQPNQLMENQGLEMQYWCKVISRTSSSKR